MRAGVILCTGTFLGGTLFRGEERFEGGRIGENCGAAAGRAVARGGPADGAAQDRHAAAARRADDRLGAAGGATFGRRDLDDVAADQAQRRIRRCSARSRAPTRAAMTSSAQISTARRCSPARSARGPALLPIDRGQDPSLRRPRRAPGVSRARGAGHAPGLSQRHQHFAAGRRPARDAARRWTGWSGSRWRCRATRSNMTISIRARLAPDLSCKRHSRALLRRPDQRHDRLRGSRGAGPGRRDACCCRDAAAAIRRRSTGRTAIWR